MQTAEIASGVRDFISVRFKVPVSDPDFTNDVHLFDYGYVDSFGALDLVIFVETTFNVKVTESDMVVFPLNTVNEIAEFVTRRRSGEI